MAGEGAEQLRRPDGVQGRTSREGRPGDRHERPSAGAATCYVVPHGLGLQPVAFGSFLKSDVVMYGRVR